MDLTVYESVLNTVLENINNNVISQSDAKIKEYLDTDTTLTDNDKAQYYANFITESTKSAISQSIASATEIALNAQVKAQEVISMQVKDKAITAESASTVAKTKAEVENRIPQEIEVMKAQTREIDKNISLKDKELLIKDKELEIRGKELEAMTLKTPEEVALLKAQTDNTNEKTTEIQLKTPKEVILLEKEASISDENINIKKQQVLIETQKVSLTEKQALTESERVNLLKEQVKVEAKQVELLEDKVPEEIKQMQTQTKVIEKELKEKLPKEIALLDSEKLYKDEQRNAVMKSLEANKSIEANKDKTNIQVATIYATGRAL